MRNIHAVEREVEELFALFVRLGRARGMKDPMQVLVAEQGLTTPQVNTLTWLAIDGPLTMGELARRLGITEKTITGVVDRLERDDLVARARDHADRRVVRVHLSKTGKRIALKVLQTAKQSMVGMLSILDDDDRASLLRIVHKVVERVSTTPAEVAEPRRRAKRPGAAAVSR